MCLYKNKNIYEKSQFYFDGFFTCVSTPVNPSGQAPTITITTIIQMDVLPQVAFRGAAVCGSSALAFIFTSAHCCLVVNDWS